VLNFRLSPEDSDKPFNITTNPGNTATITTTQPLDYEENMIYTLTIVAEDLASIDERR